MQVYRREKYLKAIRGFYHDEGMIKVIMGVRRCGKSCLMRSIADELVESGVPESAIFYSPGPEDNDMQDQKPFIVRKEDGLVLYFYDLGDKVYTEKIPFDNRF